MSDRYSFQFCQKIVVFSKDQSAVLLCKRKGEADYDGIFSFIGGKMEITDESLLVGLQREKNEEVGSGFKIKIYPIFSTSVSYLKKDGSHMILPHYYAEYLEGDVVLNEEYSEYRWVLIDDLAVFEPKIQTVVPMAERLWRLKSVFEEKDMQII